MDNRDCFWKPFASERVNESQKLRISAEKCFFPTFSSFWAKLSLKKLFLTASKILRLLVNTLTANDEYSRSNREYLRFENQINYLKNHKHFWPFFFFFFSTFPIFIKFPIFWKQHQRHSSNISEVISSERCAYLNGYQGLFLKTLWQWTRYWVPKTPEICRKVLLSYFFTIISQIEFQKVILNQIWDFRTAS